MFLHLVPTGLDERHTYPLCRNDALYSAYVVNHISAIYLDPIETYKVICCDQIQFIFLNLLLRFLSENTFF